MILNEQGLLDRDAWERGGYELPSFDRRKVTKATRENPFWIHFGGGNIFRAFQANVVQNLLNEGVLDRGLIVAEGFDYEIIEKINHLHDDYSILITLKGDGQVRKTVVGSVVESYILDEEEERELNRLKEIFQKDSLQICSFTITEKGYSLCTGKGERIKEVALDFEAGPKRPKSYLGKIAALLYTRFQAGEKPIAMVSMDNCSHNGDKLYEAIRAFAQNWVERGLTDSKFLSYINDKKKVSFPWTMIDKITPRPDGKVQEILKKDQIEGMKPIITKKQTYIAPFVNAEECEYFVVEDSFPNGRPKLEKGGFLFTDRETVNKVEKMKVCTCLNPLHTSLAIFGCLLGYEKISEEMKDPDLRRLVEAIGREGLPVAVHPGILDPKKFLDTVLQIRFPNPFMPDTPQRIATDTSQKLAIRFGETIKAYASSLHLDVKSLQWIPLVFAGWIRYLMGLNDHGEPFVLSPDPLLDSLKPLVSQLHFGGEVEEELLRPLLENDKIFGVNLYEVGMAKTVLTYLNDMVKDRGVRFTLEKKGRMD